MWPQQLLMHPRWLMKEVLKISSRSVEKSQKWEKSELFLPKRLFGRQLTLKWPTHAYTHTHLNATQPCFQSKNTHSVNDSGQPAVGRCVSPGAVAASGTAGLCSAQYFRSIDGSRVSFSVPINERGSAGADCCSLKTAAGASVPSGKQKESQSSFTGKEPSKRPEAAACTAFPVRARSSKGWFMSQLREEASKGLIWSR